MPISVQNIVDGALTGLDERQAAAVARFAAVSEADPRVVGTLMHAPRRLELFVDFYEALVRDGRAPRAAKELIERRVAELDGLERRFELPADASTLPLPDGLDPAQQALLRFLDQYAADWRAVPDAVYEELRTHYDNGQLMELFWFAAMARSLARVGRVLRIEPEAAGA